MKIFAALAILSLIGIAILGDYLWRSWMKKVSSQNAQSRRDLPPPR